MSHLSPISLSRRAASTVALLILLSACSDLTVPPAETLGIAELIVLSQQTTAPAPLAETVWISNTRQTIVRINHPDNFNTLYLELTFPAQSLASLSGAPLSSTDSVEITVTPKSGEYGFDLSPSGIAFNSGASPTAVLSFSVYGDASSGTSSTTYESTVEYVAALDVWREVTVDQWQISLGSRSTGVDAVSATVEFSGRFVLAAPR